MRWRSVASIGHQLCQDPAGRLRMNERDLQPEQADARLLVDQLDAVGTQPAELGEARSATAKATWCRPGPRLATNLPTGVSGPSARSSSTRE